MSDRTNNKKVVLITGASSGMGKVTAEQLAKEGHIVYGAARRIEQIAELKTLGGYALEVDVTNDDSMTKAVDQIIQEQGEIDILINNAGFGMYGSVEDTSIEDARYQLEVVLFGLARLSQLVIPHMREKRAGIIQSAFGDVLMDPMLKRTGDGPYKKMAESVADATKASCTH